MIVIAGDSWGRGEWFDNNNTHAGLEQYLKDSGSTVLNISRPGGSNLQTLTDLRTALNTIVTLNKHQDIEHVFVFQTDWTRDFEIPINHDIANLLANSPISWYDLAEFDSNFIDQWINSLYTKLSVIAQDYGIRIGLIGGCSDVKLSQPLLGVDIACQSLTNLLVNNVDQVSDPVLSVDVTLAEFTNKIKKAHSDVDVAYLTKLLDQADQRRHVWDSYPGIWIDRAHPNRVGHYKLFEFLTETVLK